jgi:HlyD family secretion protein
LSQALTSKYSANRRTAGHSALINVFTPRAFAIFSFFALLLCASCNFRWFGEDKRSLVFSGTVETREVRVGSKVGGRVAQILVVEGQQVTAGQPLVRLDVSELEAQNRQVEARIAQTEARLSRLENGARPEEKAQASAATAAARASLEAIKTWPRPEEVAQARSAVAASQAELNNAESAFARATRLLSNGDISQQEHDAAKFQRDTLAARHDADQERLELLLNGSRPEDIRAGEERHRQALEAEKLVRAGARTEEIADARAQVREAKELLAQLRIQIDEGEVRSPSNARVEVLSLRPGDLLTPNQPVARLLETAELWIRIYVPEPQLGMVHVGQKASVKIDTFPDRNFSGIIDQINAQGEFTPRNVQSRSERNHQVFGVKVRVDNPEGVIKSGMAADVTLSST